MYKAVVNKKSFEVTIKQNAIYVDGVPVEWDWITLGHSHFHILHRNKSMRIEAIKTDYRNKAFVLKINSQIYSISLHDKFDLILEKMGMHTAKSSGTSNIIRAPMPGLIIDVKITPGKTVQKKDAILVLEAMKMENTLYAPDRGIVKKVNVKIGDNVEKGQPLIEL